MPALLTRLSFQNNFLLQGKSPEIEGRSSKHKTDSRNKITHLCAEAVTGSLLCQ